MRTLRLPVGYENFAEIRTGDYYYIDKTGLIEQIVQKKGKVNLYTRPRRFGKTLNMSMLKYFFELGSDPSLFDGTKIAENRELLKKYQGRYPVIFLTLKDVEGQNFQGAQYRMKELVGKEAGKFSFLKDSPTLTKKERERYCSIIEQEKGKYVMDEETLFGSLQTLSELLFQHYGKKTVILIDEYDVPLDKAFQNGYYREMVSLVRAMFGKALKTNDFLEFAVLTGCLRVSKESIFTGLNNFKIFSITDARFDEQFGFTEKEVKELLAYYHQEDRFEETRKWYDGYRFGNAEIYCPWDVINHVDRINADPEARPEAYWSNTSGNGLVKRFIDKATRTTRTEIERLIAGECLEKELRLDLTYDEIDNSIENLWSVLFTTGYLTYEGRTAEGAYRIRIPNEEVREVFRLQIQDWFKKTIFSNTERLQAFWNALEEGDTEGIEKYLNRILSNSISVFDTREKENSYHNLLVGILAGNADWLVKSNVEAGEGFADIIVETDDPDAGIVVELKATKEFDELPGACRKALSQIKEKRYFQYLENEERRDIRLYGIAFCKKRCRAVTEFYEG